MSNENNAFLNDAIELTKIQAGLRIMTPDEMAAMVAETSAKLAQVAAGGTGARASATASIEFVEDPKKAIRENTITCAICGKQFRVLTKAHLAKHGLTPKEYRALCGYKKDQALSSKVLARDRRKKMNDLKLWERRGKNKSDA